MISGTWISTQQSHLLCVVRSIKLELKAAAERFCVSGKAGRGLRHKIPGRPRVLRVQHILTAAAPHVPPIACCRCRPEQGYGGKMLRGLVAHGDPSIEDSPSKDGLVVMDSWLGNGDNWELNILKSFEKGSPQAYRTCDNGIETESLIRSGQKGNVGGEKEIGRMDALSSQMCLANSAEQEDFEGQGGGNLTVHTPSASNIWGWYNDERTLDAVFSPLRGRNQNRK
ncbi:hypothetical protein QBC37DRAFT_406766 [Rhypophila decipiens]|uniref:Uncharacterized protein n=1 Tax=Rhypophila decipiens TaxID=261697 RepID=A0AAN7B3F9_9PEZI|nr:hypothetical protein QBC37DRAFT_406766 [Rhypophila decipiens]